MYDNGWHIFKILMYDVIVMLFQPVEDDEAPDLKLANQLSESHISNSVPRASRAQKRKVIEGIPLHNVFFQGNIMGKYYTAIALIAKVCINIAF